MNLEFRVDPDRMTLGDRIAMEEAAEGMTSRQQRDILAHSLVDDAGKPVEFKKACKILDALTMTQLNDAAQKFFDAVKALSNALLPPPSGSE